MSQPRARDVARGKGWRRVKRATVSGRRMGRPWLSMAWANFATSWAVEKRPAWGATPPRMKAFSSWTSPWMILWRKVLRMDALPLGGVCGAGASRAMAPAPHSSDGLSSAVGGIFARSSAGGLKVVLVMESGAKISRWQKRSRDSSATRSRAMPRMMNPMSLYSARVAGFAASGVVTAASRRLRVQISTARQQAGRSNDDIPLSSFASLVIHHPSSAAPPS